MALHPDIRDQAYQFFIEEAPELLQVIEAGLLMLTSDRNTSLVHTLMRAAHSIKGGAASVELDAIATLAHRLENIFKVLYSEVLEIDTELESQLLQAYDCLRLPLTEQIASGYFDIEQALDQADPIFTQLEERFADALERADTYLPTSEELGFDMTQSIFEVDVVEGIERLKSVVAHPSDYEVAGELRAQAEVFSGFAELLNEPGFGAIAMTTLAALDAHPDRALEITQLALADFESARLAVLASNAATNVELIGDREIAPSAALVALASSTTNTSRLTSPLVGENQRGGEGSSVPPFREENASSSAISPRRGEREGWEGGLGGLGQLDDLEPTLAGEEDDIPSIEDVFGGTFAETELDSSLSAEEVSNDTQTVDEEWVLGEIFNVSDEFLDELSADEVTDDMRTVDEEWVLEETFNISPASLDELRTAEVPEDTLAWEQDEENSVAHSPFPSGALPHSEVSSECQRHPIPSKADEEQEPEEALALFSEDIVDGEAIAPDPDADIDVLDFSRIIDIEWVDEGKPKGGQGEKEDKGDKEENLQPPTFQPSTFNLQPSTFNLQPSTFNLQPSTPETLEEALQSIEQIFDSLPPLQEAQSTSTAEKAGVDGKPRENALSKRPEKTPSPAPAASSTLSVRVDSERLEQINNLVGELSINRNSLSLQNEQLQGSVRELLNRFTKVQNVVGLLQDLSDQMLIAPERFSDGRLSRSIAQFSEQALGRADFDSLELDSYGVLHSRLQGLLEEMMQLEEAVDDIVLFAKASDRSLEQQRQMLIQLRDQLMWARMLPLGEVLQRFPRMLRDLSTTYRKPVALKLSGTNVLVDKAILEKLYDPLLHLLRNAFDHGIEPPDIRQRQGKPEQGQIEICAYHQGSQSIIEVRDDGQGLNLERIRSQALEQGLLCAEQLATTSPERLSELIFEPGFSTATQVSELSGRGVGLDVVRAQMRSLKGTIAVSFSPGGGTTFTLRLPLTLSVTKLLVGFVGSAALALPSDSIEEIVVPKAEQLRQSGTQEVLHWRGQLVPTYRLADLLVYNCPLPETSPNKALLSVSSRPERALPLLVLRQEKQIIALEIDRLVTEQELVIKPFGEAIAPPSCTYGCTILGDGSLVPVLDTTVLLDRLLKQGTAVGAITTSSQAQQAMVLASDGNTQTLATAKAPTVLIVDDAVALRRTLALTLERAGCRVLQARDGREAIEQLQQTSDAWGLNSVTRSVDLVICDIEMPNMNGFEFLGARRQDSQLSKIPVVMLTSRSNDKHRWLAMQLGATAYFTKPYLEQEFVRVIKHIIRENQPESIPALQPTQ